ncbi:MAG: hypothetical protein ACTSVI_01250 [Promethearchaeota archaeon]
MDRETSIGMKLTVLGAGISFIISLIAYIKMSLLLPEQMAMSIALADYQSFLNILIAATIIQFVILPVLLTFFINDSGELENFTKQGLIEDAWIVNIIGVITMIVSGGIMGWAMSSLFVGWKPIADPQSVYAPAIRLMNISWFIQVLGFGIPLFYFLLSKILAKKEIPFKKNETIADFIGLIFSILIIIPPALLIISNLNIGIAGLFGIMAVCIGVVWCLLYYVALDKRELPDIPED